MTAICRGYLNVTEQKILNMLHKLMLNYWRFPSNGLNSIRHIPEKKQGRILKIGIPKMLYYHQLSGWSTSNVFQEGQNLKIFLNLWHVAHEAISITISVSFTKEAYTKKKISRTLVLYNSLFLKHLRTWHPFLKNCMRNWMTHILIEKFISI